MEKQDNREIQIYVDKETVTKSYKEIWRDRVTETDRHRDREKQW